MSESTEPHPEKNRKWLFRSVKLFLFIIAFFAIIFTVMANMGGSSDTLRGAVEEFFANLTGYQVKVDTLNRMSFFPDMGLDIKEVEMRDPDAGVDPVVIMGRMIVAMQFWDVVFSTGKLKNVYIAELTAMPGSILKQKLYLREVKINDDGESDVALLEGFGSVGERPLSFQADMQASGKPGKRKFKFPDTRNFMAAAGDLGVQGTFVNLAKGVKINDLKATIPEQAMSGALTVEKIVDTGLTIMGHVETPTGTSMNPVFNLDTSGEKPLLRGEIKIPVFYAEDFKLGGKPYAFLKTLGDILGLDRHEDGTLDLSAYEMKVSFEADNVIKDGKDLGPIQTTISVAGGRIALGSLTTILEAE